MKVRSKWIRKYEILLCLFYSAIIVTGFFLMGFNQTHWNVFSILGLILFLLGFILWAISLVVIIEDDKE